MNTQIRKYKSLLLYTIILCAVSVQSYSQTKWFATGSDKIHYVMGIDSSIKYDTGFAMTIKSNSDEIPKSGFGTYMTQSSPALFLGKKIKMTAYVKSEEVMKSAGLWLRIDQAGSEEPLSFDNMWDRPINGTTGWAKYEIVLPVPANASNMAYGALLSGTGNIWFRDIHFEIVDDSVKTTGN